MSQSRLGYLLTISLTIVVVTPIAWWIGLVQGLLRTADTIRATAYTNAVISTELVERYCAERVAKTNKEGLAELLKSTAESSLHELHLYESLGSVSYRELLAHPTVTLRAGLRERSDPVPTQRIWERVQSLQSGVFRDCAAVPTPDRTMPN